MQHLSPKQARCCECVVKTQYVTLLFFLRNKVASGDGKRAAACVLVFCEFTMLSYGIIYN